MLHHRRTPYSDVRGQRFSLRLIWRLTGGGEHGRRREAAEARALVVERWERRGLVVAAAKVCGFDRNDLLVGAQEEGCKKE